MRQQTVTWKASVGTAAALAAVLACAAPLAAQQETGVSMQGEHVVRPGDTLWDLARRYLHNPFLWGLIYEANRGTVANPHLIFPNDRIRIPGLPVAGGEAEPVSPLIQVAAPPERTRFYRPSAVDADEYEAAPADEADDAPTSVRIEEFYAAPWVAQPNALPVVGELVAVLGRESTVRKLPSTAFPSDRIYLDYRGSGRTPQVGELQMLVRTEDRVGRLGRVIRPTALVRVTGLETEVYEAVVVEQFDRARTGDLAIVMPVFEGPVADASIPVESGPVGRLVAFVDDPMLPRETSLGFIDLGAEHGVGLGDELLAYRPERRAGGGYKERLPAEAIARLRVVRVDERSATVRVVNMELPILEAGAPVRLVARAP